MKIIRQIGEEVIINGHKYAWTGTTFQKISKYRRIVDLQIKQSWKLLKSKSGIHNIGEGMIDPGRWEYYASTTGLHFANPSHATYAVTTDYYDEVELQPATSHPVEANETATFTTREGTTLTMSQRTRDAFARWGERMEQALWSGNTIRNNGNNN